MDEDKHQAKNVWAWNNKLHIIYHPRGCKICKEYGDLEMDDDYAIANRIRRQEVNYWKIKNKKYFEELEDADTRIRRLEARGIELEDQLEDSHDYDDRRNGKCACYGGPRGLGSGAGSPALSTPTSGPSIPVSQTPTTYAGTLSAPPRVNVQEDVVMEEGETAAFPPLPYPGQPSQTM